MKNNQILLSTEERALLLALAAVGLADDKIQVNETVLNTIGRAKRVKRAYAIDVRRVMLVMGWRKLTEKRHDLFVSLSVKGGFVEVVSSIKGEGMVWFDLDRALGFIGL